MQYTTNFAVYAGRSEQYRRAYAQYLRWAGRRVREWGQRDRARPRQTVFIINPGPAAARELAGQPAAGFGAGLRCVL